MPHKCIAGVDEAGRGPLAGPVVAAVVILDARKPISGLADSKQLSALKREELAARIHVDSVACEIGRSEVDEIDNLNILQASLLAMRRAVDALNIEPDLVLVDGNHGPAIDYPVKTIIRGDSIVPVISAASIVAKVYRDNEMVKLDKQYPGYGFARHKGYATREHISALQNLGVTSVHRQTFTPVRKIIQGII